MNQKKIGKFISICRKNKNLTQEQLAEILNISVDVFLLPDIETSKRMLNDELENLLGDLTSYEREKIYSIINNIKQLMKKEK